MCIRDRYNKIMNSELKIPNFISDRGKQLLRSILQKVPEQRLTIQQIRQHDFNIFYGRQAQQNGIIWGVTQIQMDEEIIAELQNYYVLPAESKQMIQSNKHNWVTATYYLLLNKKQRLKDQSSTQNKKKENQGRAIHQKSEHTHVNAKKVEIQNQANQQQQQVIAASPLKKQSNLQQKVAGTGGSSERQTEEKELQIQNQQQKGTFTKELLEEKIKSKDKSLAQKVSQPSQDHSQQQQQQQQNGNNKQNDKYENSMKKQLQKFLQQHQQQQQQQQQKQGANGQNFNLVVPVATSSDQKTINSARDNYSVNGNNHNQMSKFVDDKDTNQLPNSAKRMQNQIQQPILVGEKVVTNQYAIKSKMPNNLNIKINIKQANDVNSNNNNTNNGINMNTGLNKNQQQINKGQADNEEKQNKSMPAKQRSESIHQKLQNISQASNFAYQKAYLNHELQTFSNKNTAKQVLQQISKIRSVSTQRANQKSTNKPFFAQKFTSNNDDQQNKESNNERKGNLNLNLKLRECSPTQKNERKLLGTQNLNTDRGQRSIAQTQTQQSNNTQTSQASTQNPQTIYEENEFLNLYNSKQEPLCQKPIENTNTNSLMRTRNPSSKRYISAQRETKRADTLEDNVPGSNRNDKSKHFRISTNNCVNKVQLTNIQTLKNDRNRGTSTYAPHLNLSVRNRDNKNGDHIIIKNDTQTPQSEIHNKVAEGIYTKNGRGIQQSPQNQKTDREIDIHKYYLSLKQNVHRKDQSQQKGSKQIENLGINQSDQLQLPFDENCPSFSISTINKNMVNNNNQNTKSDSLKTKFVPNFMNSINQQTVQGQRLLKYKLKRIKKITPEQKQTTNVNINLTLNKEQNLNLKQLVKYPDNQSNNNNNNNPNISSNSNNNPNNNNGNTTKDTQSAQKVSQKKDVNIKLNIKTEQSQDN
eukprot:TRINITY_DN9619_c0_g1_i4.p1 TRINITY_DN9619_c0_g1~~TRINITY_DN9619_c0_g1_i4.p1  ORF type:complete len:923 (+),score=195.43 TRINITY_DN9619_c0_g1_i4:181-2949(+)